MPTDYDSPTTWAKVYPKYPPRVAPYDADWEWRAPGSSVWQDTEPPDGPGKTRRARWLTGYDKAYFENHRHIYEARRDGILAAFPAMQAGDRYFFVGSGYGYLCTVFNEAGYGVGTSWVIEPSAPVQAGKAINVVGNVILINERLRSGMQFLNAMRSATGERTADWVIDDEILLGYSDAEIVADQGGGYRFVDLFEAILTGSDESHIIHLVRQGTSNIPEVIRRPMVEWEAFDPAHSWLDVEVT